uniref:Uncharacterized protein n=1 Tax=Arundo donax TaxID=35708 RepID=A0A0A9G8Q2_ARUDO
MGEKVVTREISSLAAPLPESP